MTNFLVRFKRSLGLALLASTLVTTGLGCNAAVTPKPKSANAAVITIWGVYDDADVFDSTFKAYQALHPNVSFDYRKFRPEEYESELLNAFAEDRGPDVYMVHNTWIDAYVPKLLAMPASTKTAFREIQGVNKKPVWVEKTTGSIPLSYIRDQFIDQVSRDVVVNAPVAGQDGKYAIQVFGLPLAVDTLALYYNKDALNAAGLPTAAQSWTELQDQVKRLTQYDEQGKLKRPAVGLGAFQNVNHALDILSLLMMQNGTDMTDENGNPAFQRMPRAMTREVNPGLEALTFYTDFANPTKDVFTWDDAQPNSFDAFVAGATAYYFGYSSELATIRAQAPKLNFGVAPVPQIDPQNFKRNYANYWVLGVSRKTKVPDLAWSFTQFAASEAQVKSYLAASRRLTALRSLIPAQVSDNDLAPFATQLLTATSWYHGVNIKATVAAFSDLVKAVLSGAEPQQALNLAAEAVGQTIR